MKKLLFAVLFLTGIALLSCTPVPLEPEDPEGSVFLLQGSWQDASWSGIWTISTNFYTDDGGGWYDLSACVHDINTNEKYFVIEITSHSTDTNQEGKFTKVYWRNFQSVGTEKFQVKMIQHYPQSNTLSGALNQDVGTQMSLDSWSIFTNI